MRLAPTIVIIGILLVPLISAQTDSSDDEFVLPTLEDLRSNLKELWSNYKKGFGLIFTSSADEIHRLRIFKKKLKMIIKHNLEYELGLHTYRLGVNNHTLLAENEFREKFFGLLQGENNSPLDSNFSQLYTPTLGQTNLPLSIDWRDQNIITPVKNQGRCGSCWAFSVLGAVEAYYLRTTGRLLDLSEQQLIDCSGDFGNMGCNGGFLSQTFEYIRRNNGVTHENYYPYTGRDGGACSARNYPPYATVAGTRRIPSGNERALQEAIALQGPVVVAMHAKISSFENYRSGVYSDPNCSLGQLDHAVLVVGYGVENHPIKGRQEFYIIKNSWGTSWGENGYAKIARNRNMCGISLDAVYPILNPQLFQNETPTD